MTLQPLPFRPEIRLYAPTPQSGLNAWLASENHDAVPPYWAYAWAGGAALVLYLQDRPGAVAGKTILDFGAGSGVVGIAAMRAGARAVWSIEPDPVARVALQLNAEANGVTLEPWTSSDLPATDMVLAGDVFYSPQVVAETLPVLTRLARAGANVLVGDPFRRDLPIEHLDPVAEYAVSDMGGSTPVRSGVFALRRDRP